MQRNARYLAEKLLPSLPETRPHRYPFAWALAFPDVKVPGPMGSLQRELIIDHDDLAYLPECLHRVAGILARSIWKDRAEAHRALKALERALGRSVLTHRPLRIDLKGIQTQIVRLSEEQYMFLRTLGAQKEAIICGCAGSGKTFMATRRARELYRQGYRVPLTCFNRPLAEWLERVTYDEIRTEDRAVLDRARLVIRNYHGLCRDLAELCGIPAPRETTGPRDPAWADTLQQAAERIGPQTAGATAAQAGARGAGLKPEPGAAPAPADGLPNEAEMRASAEAEAPGTLAREVRAVFIECDPAALLGEESPQLASRRPGTCTAIPSVRRSVFRCGRASPARPYFLDGFGLPDLGTNGKPPSPLPLRGRRGIAEDRPRSWVSGPAPRLTRPAGQDRPLRADPSCSSQGARASEVLYASGGSALPSSTRQTV